MTSSKLWRPGRGKWRRIPMNNEKRKLAAAKIRGINLELEEQLRMMIQFARDLEGLDDKQRYQTLLDERKKYALLDVEPF
jgi:hypothetical protein